MRDQVFRRAVSPEVLPEWRDWFETMHPGVDVPAWALAPVDLRQKAVRKAMAGNGGVAHTAKVSDFPLANACATPAKTNRFPENIVNDSARPSNRPQVAGVARSGAGSKGRTTRGGFKSLELSVRERRAPQILTPTISPGGIPK